jgi:hypothetical protein
VFPIPANNVLNIKIHSEKFYDGKVSIYSLTGTLLFTEELILNPGSNITPIDISELSSGMYMVEINSEIGSKKIKFIKN